MKILDLKMRSKCFKFQANSTLEIWKTALKREMKLSTSGYPPIACRMTQRATIKLGFILASRGLRRGKLSSFQSGTWPIKGNFSRLASGQFSDQLRTWSGVEFWERLSTKCAAARLTTWWTGIIPLTQSLVLMTKYSLRIPTLIRTQSHLKKHRKCSRNFKAASRYIFIARCWFILLRDEKWNLLPSQATKISLLSGRS